MHTLPKAAAKCRRRPPPMVPETLTVKSMVGRVQHSESTAIGTPADEFCHVVAIQSLAEHLTLKTENSPQNPRNITFITMKQPCTRSQKRPPNAAAVVRQWFLKPETLNLNPS